MWEDCLRCFGLEFSKDTEDPGRELWENDAANDTVVTGYYGIPCRNQYFGKAQFVLRKLRDAGDPKKETVKMDVHSVGNCVWNVRLSAIDVTDKDSDLMTRRCLAYKPEGGGGAVIHIVNADVLPSFEEGEEIKLQMVAFPLRNICYYADEKTYWHHKCPGEYPDVENCEPDGAVISFGVTWNLDTTIAAEKKEDYWFSQVNLRGTVKQVLHEKTGLETDEKQGYVRCTVGTEYGDLEIVHTEAEVSEFSDEIRVGAVVEGAFYLSGDAAIHEYQNGIILDEAHDFKLLRSVLGGADAERLQGVLAQKTILINADGNEWTERKDIVSKLRITAKRTGHRYFPHIGTVAEAPEGKRSRIGRLCVALISRNTGRCGFVLFADLGDDGKICRLELERGRGYRIRLEEKLRRISRVDAAEYPENLIRPLVERAKAYGMIGRETEWEDVVASVETAEEYEFHIRQTLSALANYNEMGLDYLYGYLFCMSVQETHARRIAAETHSPLTPVLYEVSWPWWGHMGYGFLSLLPDKCDQNLRTAMKQGMLFAEDFKAIHPFPQQRGEEYDADLRKALTVMQQLGRLYEPKCMAKNDQTWRPYLRHSYILDGI